jgi:hypothetical protein
MKVCRLNGKKAGTSSGVIDSTMTVIASKRGGAVVDRPQREAERR